MIKVLHSREAYKTYASFCVNVAAGWFLAIFISQSYFDLTVRLFACIIAVYTAIFLERKSL